MYIIFKAEQGRMDGITIKLRQIITIEKQMLGHANVSQQ